MTSKILPEMICKYNLLCLFTQIANMERRKSLVLIIVFLFITFMFYNGMRQKQSEKQTNLASFRFDVNEIDHDDNREEVLGKPIDSIKKGTLQSRTRDHRDRERIPQVEIPLNLPDTPKDADQPGRLYHPNMTHLVDLNVEEAFKNLVHEYLAPWLHPVDPVNKPPAPLTQRALATMEFSYKGGSFRVRIANGRLYYRKLVYWKQTYRSQRMVWYLRFLHDMLTKDKLLDDLPPVDFVIYVGDGPKVAADTFTTDAGFPLFSLRTSLTHVDIPVPDPVSHGSNGQYQWTESGKRVPWEQRKEKLIFRGRGSCLKMQVDNWHVCNRVKAQRLATEHSDLLDIGIIEWNQLYQSRLTDPLTEAEVEATTSLTKVEPMDFDGQSRFKYILDLDGGLGSSRKPGILSSGSVLFSQDSPWYCFYEPLMAAYRHYIPVDRWLRGLVDKVQWLKDHDDIARSIQKAGVAFERKFLTISASKTYMAILLKEYSKLLKEPFKGNEPITIDYCEKMSGSHGAAEIMSGPMGCSTGWLEYTGENSIPEHVINDRAAFKSAQNKDPIYG